MPTTTNASTTFSNDLRPLAKCVTSALPRPPAPRVPSSSRQMLERVWSELTEGPGVVHATGAHPITDDRDDEAQLHALYVAGLVEIEPCDCKARCTESGVTLTERGQLVLGVVAAPCVWCERLFDAAETSTCSDDCAHARAADANDHHCEGAGR